MKKFIQILGVIFLSIIILLIIAMVGIFIFLKNFDIKKYKPQIIKTASEALGRPVDFKNIDLKVSFNEGVWLNLSDLTIKENPEFGTTDFLSAETINVGVDIRSYIFFRQISIPNILIRSPKINIVRDSKGSINVQTIGQTKTITEKTSVNPAMALPAIFVRSFTIDKAEIHLLDRSIEPNPELSVTKLSIAVKNFSLTNAFDLNIEGAIFSAEPDLAISGKAQLNLGANQIKLNDFIISADLDRLAINEIRAFPMLKDLPIPSILKGKLKTKIKEAEISDKGLDQINLDIDLNAALYQDQTNVTFNGNVIFDFKTLDAKLQKSHFETDLNLWPIKKIQSELTLLNNLPLPEKMSGKFQTDISLLQISPKGLTDILLNAKLDDAAIELNNIIPGKTIAVNNTSFSIENFTLNKPFLLTLKTAYLTDTPNIFVDGKIALDLKNQNANIKNLTASIDLDNFPLDKLKATGFIPDNVPFPQILAGKIQANINDISVSAKDLDKIKTDLTWQKGKLAIKDVAPGVSINANNINIGVTKFSLTDPFDVTANIGYESDEPNIYFNGSIALDLATQNIKLTNSTIKTDLAKISLDRLKESILPLKTAPLPENLKGQLEIFIKNLTAGAKGLITLDSKGSLQGAEVKLKELNVPIQKLDTTFDLTQTNFNMSQINANIGKGLITAQASITDYLTAQNFNATAELKGIDLAEILSQEKAPVKINGLVSGNIKAVGKGSDLNSITGDGKFEIKEAKLKDLNVLKTILDKISFIPNVSNRIETDLPEKYKQKLNSSDTDINKVEAVCAIANGNINIDPIAVEADEFIFSGKSQANFAQEYTVDGAFKIPAELSAIMAKSVKEMEYLYDTESNISLPIHVSGKGAQAPKFAVTQTAIEMGKGAIRNEGAKQLEKVLDKFLGGKTSQNPDQQTQGSTQTTDQPQDNQSASKEIVNTILNTIFKQ
ncbi:MAG: AsmA family protein [Candidatus Omnitrophica bacterium]|nr:AsmA family protein [Candidatus Omnitrophota bacterium]